MHGLVDGDHPHSTVANPGLAVPRSNARTGQRRSAKVWLPPDITQAKAVAGDKYVALAGSQATQQCLRAGLLDEIQVALVPLLLGGGVRLFATSADRSAGNRQRARCSRRDPPQLPRPP